MTLYLIGIGLSDEKDITLRGLETVRRCEKVYLESYTSKMSCSVSDLEKLYGKKVIIADRDMVEKNAEKTILKEAKTKDVALLVMGDSMSATTHVDLVLRARKAGIKVEIIHNASIMNAVGDTGLELYKFGKTTSIPFPEKSYEPETAYEVIKGNNKIGLHTLILLDVKPKQGMFMRVNEAIEILLKIEQKRKEDVFTEDTLCIGCARTGFEDAIIKSGNAKELLDVDFGEPPHCLIIPGKLHFMEEEALKIALFS